MELESVYGAGMNRTISLQEIAERLCNVSQAAQDLGVSTATVKNLCGRGTLDSIRPAQRLLLIDRLSIDRYLRDHPQKGNDQ